MSQAAQEVRGESRDLLQAPEHREEPPGGDVPDCQRLRTGGGHRSGSNSESSVGINRFGFRLALFLILWSLKVKLFKL